AGGAAGPSGVVLAQYVQPPAPPAPAAPGAPTPGPAAPRLLAPVAGPGPLRQYTVAPRTGAGIQFKSEVLPSGEQASIFTGGVIIGARTAESATLVDIEADIALV